MHMEYKVKLLIHVFVIGPQQKLFPSVFGVGDFTNTDDVPYSGYTFIRIRSRRHDTSNAYTYNFRYMRHISIQVGKMKTNFINRGEWCSILGSILSKTVRNSCYSISFIGFECLTSSSGCSWSSCF